MVKLIGSVMLILGSGIVGLIIAHNFALRPQQIRHLLSALQMLETEVLFGLTPLPIALKRVGNKLSLPINQLFFNAGEYLKMGEGFTAGEAWEMALQELSGDSALLAEDLDILLYFGQNLGGSHSQEQEKNFRLVQNQLKNAEIRAEEIKMKNTRVWQYLGFGFGGIITLMLL